MILPGTRGQEVRLPIIDASGTIATGGTAQLLLPEAKMRSFLFIQNIDSTGDLYVEFGGARAHAVLTSGKVTSIVVDNAGFNYTYPPAILLFGGGNSGQNAVLGVGQKGYPAPGDPAYVAARYFDMSTQRPATAAATLSPSSIAGSQIASIVVSDGGAGYQTAPQVFIQNALRDPFGVAIPSATSGIWLQAGGGSLYFNGTHCTTDAISIFGAATATRFTCKYSAD